MRMPTARKIKAGGRFADADSVGFVFALYQVGQANDGVFARSHTTTTANANSTK